MALAMHSLLRRGGSEYESGPDTLLDFVEKMERPLVRAPQAPAVDVRDVLEKSFQSVACVVGAKFGDNRGMQNLAALLAVDDEAPLADVYTPEAAKTATYEELLSHILSVASSPSASEKTLIDILNIARLSMYLWKALRTSEKVVEDEPNAEELHVKEIYEDYVALRPMHHSWERKGYNLDQVVSGVAFVQGKWDAAGATQACIRVVARHSGGAEARLAAWKLLATLLHGAQSPARDTMASFLTQHHKLCSGFFQTCALVLDHVLDLLKDYKRNVRTARERAQGKEAAVEAGGVLDEEEDEATGATNIEEWIGRQGHAMVLLRVLQLMCSGDKAQDLQDLTSLQPKSSVNFDLVSRLLDIFSRSQVTFVLLFVGF